MTESLRLSNKVIALLTLAVAVMSAGIGYIIADARQNSSQELAIQIMSDRLDKIEHRLDTELIGQRRFDDMRSNMDRQFADLRTEQKEIRGLLEDHERQSRLRRQKLVHPSFPAKTVFLDPPPSPFELFVSR